jgi:predicted transglutaminase-like cysteine proteinase
MRRVEMKCGEIASQLFHWLSCSFATLPAWVLLAPASLAFGVIFGLYSWDWFNAASELRRLAIGYSAPGQVSNEPFGVRTLRLSGGPIAEKWAGVQISLRNEKRRLDLCQKQQSRCGDPQAADFSRIVEVARVRQGIARLGEVNRAINLAIKPVSDLANYGEIDVWSSPLSTLAKGSGDCEDYAIAKMVALREAGVPSHDLRLVILRNTTRTEDHAVLAVRQRGIWLILDNRMLVMLNDSQLRGYHPLFIIDADGVGKVTS